MKAGSAVCEGCGPVSVTTATVPGQATGAVTFWFIGLLLESYPRFPQNLHRGSEASGHGHDEDSDIARFGADTWSEARFGNVRNLVEWFGGRLVR